MPINKDETSLIVFAGDTYRNRYWSGSPGGHNKGKFKKLKKKCAKCGSTKNLDIHHKSGNRNDLKTGKGLQVLCRSCHRSLHQGKGKGSDEFMNRIELTCEGRIINEVEVDQDRLSEALGDKKQRDLLFVAFKLVHAGTNKNRDHFTEKELKAGYRSPIHKPLNWMHGEPNIGVIYDSKFRGATKDEPAYLEVAAAVWKYKYREFAQQMLERYDRGNLQFSMEVWFRGVTCLVCGEAYDNDQEGDFCEHLDHLYKSKASGTVPTDEKISRQLNEICFGGAGVVDTPADELADCVAVASEINKKEVKQIMSDVKTYTEDELRSEIERAVKSYQDSIQNDQAKADLERKLLDTEGSFATLKAEHAVTKEALANIETEFATFKATVELERIVEARLDTLRKSEFDIPEDEEELKALRDLLGSFDEKKFETFAEFSKNLAKKSGLSDMSPEDRKKHFEELKKKKKAAKGSDDDAEADEKSDASTFIPNGGPIRDLPSTSKAIEALDSFLSGKSK